jgi:hypothetical protein
MGADGSTRYAKSANIASDHKVLDYSDYRPIVPSMQQANSGKLGKETWQFPAIGRPGSMLPVTPTKAGNWKFIRFSWV